MSPKRPPDEGRLIQLVYYAYVGLSLVARWLPERAAYGLAHAVGSMQARRSRGKNSQVERNLARITGLPLASDELQAVVAEAFRSYARYWLETFRAVREKAEFFIKHVEAKGVHHVGDQLDAGRGAVLLVGHLGNWDAAGAWAGAVGWQVVTVAETLKPKRMFEFFVAHRERLGLVIHPAEKGVTSKLIEAVKKNSLVPILGDRDLKGDGVEVEFFGEYATFPRGPAAVAVRTGSPLIFAGVRGRRTDDGKWGWGIDFHHPIDPPSPDDPDGIDRLTTEAIGQLEAYIRQYPTEWHVFQPFWTADRVQRSSP